jgi:murein DD-endopeptidase MepM/ murein hydrolase activator NlpD
MQGPTIQASTYISTPEKYQGSREEKLRQACKDFESIFTYQLLKSMRRTVQKCDLFHGGTDEEIYQSLFDQELAKSMAGLGQSSLSELLYRQLSRVDPSIGLEKPLEQPGSAPAPARIAWPLDGRISSRFGWRNDPINGERRFHYGLDLAAAEGTSIQAPMGGRVVRSEFAEGYGNVLVLDHGRGLTTLYAHNSKNLVKEGDWVKAGDVVAKVGSTGRSTGPHLHFEVRRHGRRMDPMAVLNNENARPRA